MPFKHCYLIPIFQGLWYPLGFLTTYLISIRNDDVPAIFPYVSDTGAYSVEGCIFSVILCIGAILMLAIMYIRYRQVKEILMRQNKFKSYLQKLNRLSLVCALIGCVGLIITGTFQVSRCVFVHLTGAGVAFGSGWFFIVIQTFLSFKLYPIIGCKWMNYFRVFLMVIWGTALGLLLVFGVVAFMLFQGTIYDIVQWTEDKGGYEYHLISVAGEWIVVLGTVIFLTTYALEFKDVVFFKPEITLISDNNVGSQRPVEK